MKKIRTIIRFLYSFRLWLFSLTFVCLLFVFLAWVAYPQAFTSLITLMVFVAVTAFITPLAISIKRQKKADEVFQTFLLEPDEQNEHLLCEASPLYLHSHIRQLGSHLRKQQTDMEKYAIQVIDYESYVESWVHEIKRPLSLVTLMLDNRRDEMSPLVQSRMLHARDCIQHNVEQMLYFSRLGTAHKDYFWEQLSVLSVCKESVQDNLAMLDEARFILTFSGEDCQIVSDKKGMMFILGQLISNSVKYATKREAPSLCFDVQEDRITGKITISVRDNGSGIPASDLPFVFDKGFTGERGSYLSRSTGMGLYLVQKMAADLAIEIKIASQLGDGTTVSLTFPKVEYPVRRFENETTK